MPTLTEMEWAAHLLEKGFAVIVEPFAPDKGADLLAERRGVPYYIEIRSVRTSRNV